MTPPTVWSRPTFPVSPVPPDDVASLECVEEALLTRVARGPLRVVRRPDRWIRFAVHRADGRLVASSQKIGGLGGNQWVAADPGRVPVRADAERLAGTWVYDGHWIDHFAAHLARARPRPRPGLRRRRLRRRTPRGAGRRGAARCRGRRPRAGRELGSALHLSALAPPAAGVLEIGDERSPLHPVGMQRVIGTVTGHHHAFAAAHESGDRIIAILEDLGDPPTAAQEPL